MKKFVAVLAGMLFVLGLAASAFAVHADIPSETQAVVAKGTTQITLGGSVRVRGEIRDNADFNDDTNDSQSYWDQRVRLRLQADVSKNTTGVIHLESPLAASSDRQWGSSNAADNEGTGSYLGNVDQGNGKAGSMFILEAWIQHKGSGLLGVPAGFKIGHMPVKLGYGLFFDHSKFGDDALNVFIDPMKDLHIELLTVKLSEGNVANADDTDMYSAIISYNFNKDTSISFDATLLNEQAPAITAFAGEDNVQLWNFGLRGQTSIAGLGIRAGAELQTGNVEIAGGADQDFNGYALLAGIDYTLNPVKLSVEFAYGSGDDNAADNDIDTFQTFQSNIQKYTYVYDYRVTSAAGATNTGIANTWYIKAGASADIMKDLNALVNVYYLRAAKNNVVALAGGNTLGTDKNIGIEVDGKVTYKIDRNLVYWVEGGYLFAGDFYDRAGASADDAYAVRHGIELSF